MERQVGADSECAPPSGWQRLHSGINVTLTPAVWGANNILLLAKLPHGWRAREQSHSGSPAAGCFWDVGQREGCWRQITVESLSGLHGGAGLEAPAVSVTPKGRTHPACAACTHLVCVRAACVWIGSALEHLLLPTSS